MSSVNHRKAAELLRKIIPWAVDAGKPMPGTNHKGSRGRIGVIGGSKNYTGAPYFASISALRLGADLSYVICSSEASHVIKTYSPDLIVMPLLDCDSDKHFDTHINEILGKLHALIVGPGLSLEETMLKRAKICINIAKSRSLPIVIDADGLSIIRDDPSIISEYPKAIITPNKIELERFIEKLDIAHTNDNELSTNSSRVENVKECSNRLKVTICAKGQSDYICSPKNDLVLETRPDMGSSRRVGGQGDILSGLVGVFMYWIDVAIENQVKIENPTLWAAYFAAYIVKHCNKLAFEEKKYGLLSEDMIKNIPNALQYLLNYDHDDDKFKKPVAEYAGDLTTEEINRYQRQMLVPQLGPGGQIKLKNSSVLIIGAGGLGCPSSIYLAAAGFGRIGIVDDDIVEESNLHRQILHQVERVGMPKVESIKRSLLAINPKLDCETYQVRLSRHNAVGLVEKYDIVLDATDNLATRYMINDACVVANKPLVSGAALRTDGQLSVYNYNKETPCFRCLFPLPPKPDAVGSCSEEGVLGVVPGLIGVLQAFEAIKIATNIKPSYAGKLLVYSGLQGEFRILKISSRKKDCSSCGENSKLDRNLIDYDDFCGVKCTKETEPVSYVPETWRISIKNYADILKSGEKHLLLDVRPEDHYQASRIAHALNIPMSKLLDDPERVGSEIRKKIDESCIKKVYVVCRKGISSQKALAILVDVLDSNTKESDIFIKDIIGGMTGWSAIDPLYKCI